MRNRLILNFICSLFFILFVSSKTSHAQVTQCALTTPDGKYNCAWDTTRGRCYGVLTDCCVNKYFQLPASDLCVGLNYTECTAVSPAPSFLCKDALPPDFEQCNDKCDANSANNVGNCINTADLDPARNCTRPPDPNSGFDCTIGTDTVDCWCCNQILFPMTTRLSLNVLCGENSIDTALGCINVGDKKEFLKFILQRALGIAGGTSFILIIYAGFLVMTSGGDKRKLQSGKELLTAAISGLMLIIFSVFVLDFIGIKILRIPGL